MIGVRGVWTILTREAATAGVCVCVCLCVEVMCVCVYHTHAHTQRLLTPLLFYTSMACACDGKKRVRALYWQGKSTARGHVRVDTSCTHCHQYVNLVCVWAWRGHAYSVCVQPHGLSHGPTKVKPN